MHKVKGKTYSYAGSIHASSKLQSSVSNTLMV